MRVTTFGPALTTVTGTTRLFSSNTCVMPSLVPRMPFLAIARRISYWMLTSTLAGRSMRISASTVFGVGSRMSISRL